MKDLAMKHPVLTFLSINFTWTWLFWLAAIPFRDQTLLLTGLVMIGGFGPAIGGIVTLGLRSAQRPHVSGRRIAVMAIAAGVLAGLMVVRYLVGNVEGYEVLARELALSVPVLLAALAAAIVGGWVVSSAVSDNADVRARMSSILPRRAGAGWALLAVVFYPAMILVAWGLSALLGMGIEYPSLWGSPLAEILPLYALTFAVTMTLQGGMEEPGWRGLMQPELQRRFSPLVGALIVSAAWSLWHLPLYLNGFYPGDLVGGMVGGGIFRILLAIFLAWFYNRSNGNLFGVIVLHTCFNSMVNFLPTSDLGLLVLWLVVVIVVVVKDKMWRRLPSGQIC